MEWINKIRKMSRRLALIGVGLLLESIAGLERTWVWAILVIVCIAIAIEWQKISWFQIKRWQNKQITDQELQKLRDLFNILQKDDRSPDGYTHNHFMAKNDIIRIFEKI